jgi:hypothetical protein
VNARIAGGAKVSGLRQERNLTGVTRVSRVAKGEEINKLLAFLLALALPQTARAQGSVVVDYDPYRHSAVESFDVYEYPVVPMTPEWDTVHKDSTWQVIQIPSDVLTSMSTRGLAHTCLKTPFRHSWVIPDGKGVNAGILRISKGSNAFAELLQRTDAGPALFEVYQSMDPDAPDSSWERTTRFWYEWDLALIEVLLSRDEIRSGLTNEAKVDLLTLVVDRYRTRATQKEGCMSSLVLMGRLLIDLDSPDMVSKYDADVRLKTALNSPHLMGFQNPAAIFPVIQIAMAYIASMN